jgi:hypothetical protein
MIDDRRAGLADTEHPGSRCRASALLTLEHRRTMPRMRSGHPLPLLLLVGLLGCSKNEPGTDQPAQGLVASGATGASTTQGTASGSAAAAPAPLASASAPPPAGPPPSCKVLSQKSWGKGANKLAGLTASELPDGRVAIGAAFGLTPHVLVVSKGGQGMLVKVPAREGSHLARVPKASEGVRRIMRVTPVKVSGNTAEAFVDYRDEYKDKRRRISCGPADGDDAWIHFDGISPLDRDEGAEMSAEERAALFKKKEEDSDEGYHELRDCRSFSDLKTGETWIVGSDLRGFDKGTSIAWSSSLVVDRGAKVHEAHIHDIHIHEQVLKGTPPRIARFEVPISYRVHDGRFLLAARYESELVAAILTPQKTLQGDVRTYRGFPTIPDMVSDGKDTVLVTSVAKGHNDYHLRAMRLAAANPELPRALINVELVPDDKDSETDPDFTRDTRGRRWLSYVDGNRGHGKLFLSPIDENFRATGKHFEITQDKESASESRLVPLSDGTLLVVFLKENEDKSVELVTEDLECEIVKEQAP